MNAPQPYQSIAQIAIPETTQWYPQAAITLIAQLIKLDDLHLTIVARQNHISWEIHFPTTERDFLEKVIRTHHPDAQINYQPKPPITTKPRVFHLKCVADYWWPLKYLTEFDTKVDPLRVLVGTMINLAPGEQLVYELIVNQPKQDYNAIGRRNIDNAEFWRNLLPRMGGAFIQGVFNLPQRHYGASAWEIEEEREHRQQLQGAHDKLERSLYEVVCRVKVTATKERVNPLYNPISSALAQYASDNRLTPASQEQIQDHPTLLILSAEEIAALWHLPHEGMRTDEIVWATKRRPMPRPLLNRRDGITLGTGEYRGQSYPVKLLYKDRATHVNLIGRTGVGKSNQLHQMIHRDIANGCGVGVIDPHGKLVDDVLRCSISLSREDDVVLLDMGDEEYSVGLNLLAPVPGVKREELVSQAFGVIRKLFESNWSETRMETLLYMSLLTLTYQPRASLLDVLPLLTDDGYFLRCLRRLHDPEALAYWEYFYRKRSENEKSRMVEPIYNRLSPFLRNRPLRRMFGQDECLNFRHLVDNKQIFLANLNGLQGREQHVLGTLLVSQFWLAVLSRGNSAEKLPPFYLYVDEVQNFATTDLDKVLAEARKYGLSLVMANQFLSQLKGYLLDAMLGNVATTIIFRIGVKDEAIFNKFAHPEFSSNDLVNLSKFEAVVKMQLDGETLPAFSMATCKPLETNKNAETMLQRIKQNTRTRYARHKDDIDRELSARNQTPGNDAAIYGLVDDPDDYGDITTDE